MTRSTLGSDLSPSCAQPSLTPRCFSPVASCNVMHHVTRPRRMHPRACMHSPMNVWPQRVHARLLLMSPTRDLVYKSSFFIFIYFILYHFSNLKAEPMMVVWQSVHAVPLPASWALIPCTCPFLSWVFITSGMGFGFVCACCLGSMHHLERRSHPMLA